MKASQLKLAMVLLPKLPLAIRVTILHILGISEQSKYIDLRADLVVSILRSLLEGLGPRTVSQAQASSMGNPNVKGRIWISTYSSPPPPETSLRDALIDVIGSMGGGTTVRIPELAHVEAEWTGYRGAASPSQGPPKISEADKYREMTEECKEPTTVLYFHGGGYYLLDPATHRPATKRLAKLTGGRCYSVRYRLAPKHPFPSALLDALVSYFTLLYPPPDAFHEAVKPEHMVISGDSAGGNLSLALLQILLQFRRQDKHIYWYGERRQVPLPAGVTTLSPWVDPTQSAPAWQGQGGHMFDYLPRPPVQGQNSLPPCEIWPANPRRENFYAEDDLMAHPLVSVIMNGSWEGSPPMYMSTGWEFLEWEDKALARKLASDGVPLAFEEYEAMSHCFALILMQSRASRLFFDRWARFVRRAVHDPESIKASAVMIKARTFEEVPLEFQDLLKESHESVMEGVVAKARSYIQPQGSTAKL